MNQTFGFMDDMQIEFDQDDFMVFYNSTTTDLIFYYKNFMNGTNNDFYIPFTSTPIIVIFSLYVLRTYSPNCYFNVFKARNERRIQGLAHQLNVSDLFFFVLTIVVWTFCSLFIGVNYGLYIRLKFIKMKYQGLLCLNNKRSEEINKFTNKLFWFFAYMVKIGFLIQMLSSTHTQISIVEDFLKYKGFLDSISNTLRHNLDFLIICNERCYTLLALLILEFFLELVICIGYVFIIYYNQRQTINRNNIIAAYHKYMVEKEKDKND